MKLFNICSSKQGILGVKEALHNRVRTLLFLLHNVLKQLFYGKNNSKQWLPMGCGTGLTVKGHEGTLLGDDSVLYLDKSLSYTSIYICQNLTNIHLIFVHFTRVNSVLK